MGEADDGKFVAKGTVDYLRLTAELVEKTIEMSDSQHK